MAKKVKWYMRADHLEACSCDWGCPCKWNAAPTQGFCQAIEAWYIREGRYGDVQLGGLSCALVLSWPNAIHFGNGTCQIYIDKRADSAQQQALIKILSGEAGGSPFAVFANTYSTILEPKFVPISFKAAGNKSSVTIGKVAKVSHQPLRHPVTGKPHNVKLVLEEGFPWKEGYAVQSKVCRVEDEGIQFDHSGKSGYVATVKYAGP